MSSLPILLNNPRILLLGGGKVALNKARVLKENQVRFEVIARRFEAAFFSLGLKEVMWTKTVDMTDLDPFRIIVDATGDPGVREMLCRIREQRPLMLNIVDDPAASDFFFSALLKNGCVKVAVSTDGASPSLAQAVRDRIKQVIPDDIASLAEKKARDRARGIIDAKATRGETLQCLAQVDLVGCGPGDVNLLTLQACRCIEEADVVLYDHLISEDILDLVPARAEKIYVGKQKQAHSLKQEELNDITLQYALRGLKVARLKSGDPYIFGRGAEEAEFLTRHGIRVRVIPGVSSATAGPLAAGIPLTARGYATNISIVSAHLAGSRLNTDWLPLLQIPNHTTVVLMGVSFAREIGGLALSRGTPPDMPVAIVSNATSVSQKIIISTLSELEEKSRHAERPAILVFGDVIRLSSILPHWSPQKINHTS